MCHSSPPDVTPQNSLILQSARRAGSRQEIGHVPEPAAEACRAWVGYVRQVDECKLLFSIIDFRFARRPDQNRSNRDIAPTSRFSSSRCLKSRFDQLRYREEH